MLFSEGIFNAGRQDNNPIDFLLTIGSLVDEESDEQATTQEIADFLLKQAISHDSGRPRDDMTVVVLKPHLLPNVRFVGNMFVSNQKS